jgi:hypothetical protein
MSLVSSVSLAWAAAAAAACAGQLGCSSANPPAVSTSHSGTTSSADLGSDGGSEASAQASGAVNVTAQWTLPFGEQINQLAWTLTHPVDGSETLRNQQGTVGVTTSPATFLIGQLEPSASYTIALTATSTDGATACSGSASLKIQSNKTTNVTVTMACMSASPDAGYVLVNGTVSDCAVVTSVSALPSVVDVGHSVVLSASALAPDPGSVTYAWSAPTGMFSAPNSSSTDFTCTAAGTVLVSLAIGDGPLPEGSVCDASLSTATLTVTCD